MGLTQDQKVDSFKQDWEYGAKCHMQGLEGGVKGRKLDQGDGTLGLKLDQGDGTLGLKLNTDWFRQGQGLGPRQGQGLGLRQDLGWGWMVVMGQGSLGRSLVKRPHQFIGQGAGTLTQTFNCLPLLRPVGVDLCTAMAAATGAPYLPWSLQPDVDSVKIQELQSL